MYVSHYGFSPDFPQTQALRRQMQVIRSDVFKKIYLVLFAHDGTPTAIIMWPDMRPLNGWSGIPRRQIAGRYQLSTRVAAQTLGRCCIRFEGTASAQPNGRAGRGGATGRRPTNDCFRGPPRHRPMSGEGRKRPFRRHSETGSYMASATRAVGPTADCLSLSGPRCSEVGYRRPRHSGPVAASVTSWRGA